MPNERVILGRGVPDTKLPISRSSLLRLLLWGAGKNCHLHIDDIHGPLAQNIPPQFLDLIDIATYVYVADQATPRGGSGVENAGEDWRRTFFFRIPLRMPDFWSGREVFQALRDTLSFLSEDEYLFEFHPLKDAPPLQHYFPFAAAGTPVSACEEVVLFSGGLDSLGGSIEEAVTNGRKIALVTHRSSSKFSRRHRTLQELLAKHAPNAVPVYFPVEINKKKRMSREYTQRSRSFLYASLGATVAQVLGLSRIRFYENGVVSLNFHLSDQVVGAKATRTTHPRVLNGFERILSAVAGKPFKVENRFLWKTKTDVVRQIAEAGCAEMIRYSTSCTRPWELTTEKTHCGACSQCIDRRFAVLAAGQEQHDPADAYKVDLLVDARDVGEPRTMLASYVETASQIAKMSALDFYGCYGEVGRVVTQIPDPDKDRIALDIFSLYQRHARQVSKVVADAIAKHSAAIRDRLLPASCLLRLVCESGVSAPPAEDGVEDDSDSQYVFRKKGQAWIVWFAGGQEWILLPSRGAAYLHMLLSNPRKQFSVVDLVCQVTKVPKEYILGEGDAVSDEEALTNYRARYEELEEQIREAKDFNDLAAQEKAETERDKLLEHMRRDKGFHGKVRKQEGDRDKVRKAFLAAMRRVQTDIAQFDPPFAEHIKATLSCGWNPCYTPPADVLWST